MPFMNEQGNNRPLCVGRLAATWAEVPGRR